MGSRNTKTILLLDFDSTFVTCEALDELATISLAEASDRKARVAEISQITLDGMLGKIGFAESLERRFKHLAPTRTHLDTLITRLKSNISPSLLSHQEFFRANAQNIWIISGGFSDFIQPVVEQFGITPDHILANSFTWSSDGQTITGYDKENLMAHDGGKIKIVKSLDLPDDVFTVMVGDGMTDYSVRGVGLTDAFVAYTETVRREPVVDVADAVAEDFDDVLDFVVASTDDTSRLPATQQA